MPTLFFHLGHAKTASTYIQHTMQLNAPLLAEYGINVPSDLTPAGGYNYANLARNGRIYSGNAGDIFLELRKGENRKLAFVIEATVKGDQNVLLSTELVFYSPFQVEQIARPFREAGYRVELIAYLKRHDEMVISAYLQNIKNHFYRGSVSDYLIQSLRNGHHFYHAAISDMITMVRPDRFHVRSFAEKLFPQGDIVRDFFQLIGLPEEAIDRMEKPVGPVNAALSLEQYEFLRLINGTGSQQLVGPFRHPLLPPALAETKRTYDYFLTHPVRRMIADQYHDDGSSILRTYLGGARAEERQYWTKPRPPSDPVELDQESLSLLMEKFISSRLN